MAYVKCVDAGYVTGALTYGKVYEVTSQDGDFIRITDDKGLKHAGYFKWRFEQVEAPKPAVDWTKPIQWKPQHWEAKQDPHPVTVIGRDGDNYVVKLPSKEWPVYQIFKPDGTHASIAATHQYITNVPPPPLWPVTRWYVLAEIDGVACVSGPALTREAAEKTMKQYAVNHKNVRIKEVIFE